MQYVAQGITDVPFHGADMEKSSRSSSTSICTLTATMQHTSTTDMSSSPVARKSHDTVWSATSTQTISSDGEIKEPLAQSSSTTPTGTSTTLLM